MRPSLLITSNLDPTRCVWALSCVLHTTLVPLDMHSAITDSTFVVDFESSAEVGSSSRSTVIAASAPAQALAVASLRWKVFGWARFRSWALIPIARRAEWRNPSG